jgi:hypothetical protein
MLRRLASDDGVAGRQPTPGPPHQSPHTGTHRRGHSTTTARSAGCAPPVACDVPYDRNTHINRKVAYRIRSRPSAPGDPRRHVTTSRPTVAVRPEPRRCLRRRRRGAIAGLGDRGLDAGVGGDAEELGAGQVVAGGADADARELGGVLMVRLPNLSALAIGSGSGVLRGGPTLSADEHVSVVAPYFGLGLSPELERRAPGGCWGRGCTAAEAP